MSEIRTTNAVLRIVWDGKEIGPITTIAADRLRYEKTARVQGWKPLGEDSAFSNQTWIAFLAWTAAKRLGLLPADLTWEYFETHVEAFAPYEGDDSGDVVDPTPPGPGPEPSSS